MELILLAELVYNLFNIKNTVNLCIIGAMIVLLFIIITLVNKIKETSVTVIISTIGIGFLMFMFIWINNEISAIEEHVYKTTKYSKCDIYKEIILKYNVSNDFKLKYINACINGEHK